MVEIGEKPILWHIMKIYSSYGVNDFIICLGYKGYVIKEYFANYFLHSSDVTFNIRENKMEIIQRHAEPWKVTLVDTGEHTMTGGRIKRIRNHLGDEPFHMTYGDGVADIDIEALTKTHMEEKRLATVTAVQPPGRFGSIAYGDNRVTSFQEKPIGDGGWINGGFFILDPKVIDYIESDKIIWEEEPLRKLVSNSELSVYFHNGYWRPMDTLRDKDQLECAWKKKEAKWAVWA